MKWIGITGPIGSGKSTVASELRQRGYEVLDADEVSKAVMSPGSDAEAKVLLIFGEDLCKLAETEGKRGMLEPKGAGGGVSAETGAGGGGGTGAGGVSGSEPVGATISALDRRALGRLVFNDPQKLIRLESLLHPLIRDEVALRKAALAAKNAKVAFYDVPLLFEKNMQDQFDAILCVSSEAKFRHNRLYNRSGLSPAEIASRESRQLPPEHKEAQSTFVIRNNGDLTELQGEIDQALRALGVD